MTAISSNRDYAGRRIAALRNKPSVAVNSSDRIGALTRLDYGPNTYLYAARVFDPHFEKQIDRAMRS